MSRRRPARWLLCLLLSTLSACAGSQPPGPILGEDPTLSWTPVTQTCDGAPITPTYNIYAIAGPGPMPTILEGAGTVPCGGFEKIDLTKALKLNAAPITSAGPVKVLVPTEGQWTFCVEAVKSTSGLRSGIDQGGSCVTRVVQEPPGVVGGTVIAAIGEVQIEIRVVADSGGRRKASVDESWP